MFSSGLPFGGATGNEVTTLDLELDPYTIVNLSAGVEKNDWSAVLYIHNVGDENANLSFDRERGGRARLAFRTNCAAHHRRYGEKKLLELSGKEKLQEKSSARPFEVGRFLMRDRAACESADERRPRCPRSRWK